MHTPSPNYARSFVPIESQIIKFVISRSTSEWQVYRNERKQKNGRLVVASSARYHFPPSPPYQAVSVNPLPPFSVAVERKADSCGVQ